MSPASGPPAPMTTAEILRTVKPLIDAVSVQPGSINTAPFYFCTDEASQQRRTLAEMIAAEGAVLGGGGGKTYDIEWCIAALEAVNGDLDKAREWLNNWAPSKGEVKTS